MKVVQRNLFSFKNSVSWIIKQRHVHPTTLFNHSSTSNPSFSDIFMKVGEFDVAKKIFLASSSRDVVTWNSTIGGCVKDGYFLDAIGLFKEMAKASMNRTGLLLHLLLPLAPGLELLIMGSVCVCYFDIMQKNFSIQPQLEHYGAMVDLLGRAGLLEEAYALIQEMPMEPDVVTWRALLSACKTYKNHELGEIAVGEIKNLGSGDYVLLSNMYCYVYKWDNAETVTHAVNKKGVRKCRGRSWVELHGSIHYFKAGDRSHLSPVRDRMRFHSFEKGSCTCGDYW